MSKSHMKIKNKIAVVTGASGGIGFATAEKLIQYGAAKVAMVDLSEQCQAAATTLNTKYDDKSAISFCGDVTDAGFRQSVFQHLNEKYGPVQICVPAAGILADALAVKVNKENKSVNLYSESTFKKILDVNLAHPTYWAMETIAGMARDRISQSMPKWSGEEGIQGSIVLIGSVSCRGNRGQVGYAAAKAGLNGVRSTLNLEGLPFGVQTRIIHPGIVDTAMVDSIDNDYFDKHIKPMIGLQRKIQPQEIGEIICSMIENPVIGGQVWADASMAPMA